MISHHAVPNLAPHDKAAILQSVEQSQQKASGRDRRVYIRVPLPPGYSVIAELRPDGFSSLLGVATVRDVSRGGIGLLHSGQIPVGTSGRFIFVGTHGTAMIRMTGRVVRCEVIRSPIHDLGIQFDSLLPDELIFPSMQPASARSGSEQPKYPDLLPMAEQIVKTIRCGGEIEDILGSIRALRDAATNLR
jgi:hypothetical protein